MQDELPGLIDQFIEYLEIEKNCSKLTSSDTRRPVENKSSIIALSRIPSSFDVSGAVTSLSIKSFGKNFKLLDTVLGKSILEGSNVLKSFFIRNLKNDLNDIT